MPRKRAIELTDPRALRAVAHPTRLALIGLLRRSGPLTATRAGERIGQSPASCSFHLRQLAKWGLVEEAGGGRGRERPWRATADFTEWHARGPGGEPDEASLMMSRLVVEKYFEEAIEWLERQPSEPPDWAEAASESDSVLYLTAAEARELTERVGALLEPYVERLEDRAKRPSGARPVNFVRLVFPLPEEGAGEG